MDFNPSETQQMLADSARKLVADNYCLEELRQQRDIADGLNQSNWTAFAELGWLALPLPEVAGGLGGSFTDVLVLNSILGEGLAVEPYVSTVVVGGHALSAIEDEERRDALLGGIAAGSVRVALADREPGERDGDGGPRTTAASTRAQGYSITGDKMLVIDAPSATHVLVTASLEDGTPALFLIERGTAGLESEEYKLIDGAAAADLSLLDVQVGDDALVARGDTAMTLVDEIRDRGNLALMAQAVGAIEACNEVCATYVKERKQFGQPIGSFQALQHMMADMYVSAQQARSILYYAVSVVDAEPDTRRSAVSAAKLLIGEAAQSVSRAGIQLHGGYGVTDEYLVSHYYRRLLTLEKMFGDVDHHARRLAVQIFGG